MTVPMTPIVPTDATEDGALDSYGYKCLACGTVRRSSLIELAREDRAAHVTWHATKH
jgi:hypothetical protein